MKNPPNVKKSLPPEAAPGRQDTQNKPPVEFEPEILDQLEQRIEKVAIRVVQHEMHSGPMPSAKQFGEYDRVLPGTAKIIRDEFQSNSAHVREMERNGQAAAVTRDIDNRKTAERLVMFAFALILILALTGHENVAIAVAVTTVVAVISGFLRTGSAARSKSNDAEEPETED